MLILLIVLIVQFIMISDIKSSYNKLLKKSESLQTEIDANQEFIDYLSDQENYNNYVEEYAKNNGYTKSGEQVYVAP